MAQIKTKRSQKKLSLAPVAIIIFNRCDTAQRLFDALAAVKPQRLFIIADGPRQNRPDDVKKCAATRAIFKDIPWECQVTRIYSKENMGCDRRVSSGLTKVFSLVDRAMIFEDDCIPSPDFFTFATELLERYKDDSRIMQIAGLNKVLKKIDSPYSYRFTRMVDIWGWATWARAWKYFDYEMKDWPDLKKTGFMKYIFPQASENYHFTRLFDLAYNVIPTWDSRWCYAVAKEAGFSIVPNVNLVSNIGTASADATHANLKSNFADSKYEKLELPLKHPPAVFVDHKISKLEIAARKKEARQLPYPLNKWASIAKRILLRTK